MHTLYLGPSWAVQSFESPRGIDDFIKTNLAQELGLDNYTFLAAYANSNFDQLQQAQEFMQQHADLAPFRAVFLSANSLEDGHKIYNTSQIDFVKSFLTSNDPIDLVKELEHKFYQQLNSLNIPVALIGAHTDVTCKSNDNVTVIHASWQNFLAQQCGLNSFYGWAADIGHRWLHGIVIPEYGEPEHFELGKNPSAAVVDEIYTVFNHNWNVLQTHKLFVSSHPTILGNQLFAKEIADSFQKWIDNVV
jgi:hypothetical protein